ncbi:hypothetical protein EMIT0215P_150061 [Pseudomonas serboccidentalis]
MVRRLQTRCDQHIDGERAVVGAQGFFAGQASQFQHFISVACRWAFVRAGRRRCARCLGLDAVERRQLHWLRLYAVRRMIAVDRVAVGVGVLVDLRGGGQGDHQQDVEKGATHEIDRGKKVMGCSIGQVRRLAQPGTDPEIIRTPKSPVGVSLLAMVLYQSLSLSMTHRYREQAHSYRNMGRP